MRSFFHQLHLILSIPFGLVITIVCLTGASLVFEKEITEFFHRDLYTVDRTAEKTLPLEALAAQVAATLPDSVSVTGITVFSDPGKAYQVNLSKPRRASIYIDPYTGEIKGRQERPAFFTCMFKLHRWLLDSLKPGETVFVGKQIVGFSTLAFVVILLSGMAIWIPRTRKAVRNRLKIAVGKGWRRFWYDLHVAGGIYAALLLLAMALTGLTWSFPWYRTAFYAVFGVETKPSSAHHHASERKKENTFAYWQQAYEQVNTLHPDFRQLTVSKNSVSVSKDRFGNQRASDRYTFDPASGTITGESLYRDQEASGKIRGWIYSIHVGSWGGLTTRILFFLASLLGGFLPLTGYYLWIKKQSRKKKRAIRTDSALPQGE